MIATTIREWLQREPFEPFVIRASSGAAVRVASPALCVLMRTELFVAEPNSDRSTILPYLHVAGLEKENGGRGGGRRSSKPTRRR